MSYTTLDIIAEARSRLQDEGGDLAGTPAAGYTYLWEQPGVALLWSNADLMRYLNQARTEMASRVPFNDASTAAVCQIPVMRLSNASYTVDPRVLAIDSIRLGSTGKLLEKVTASVMDAIDSAWRTRLATPERYAEDYSPYSVTLGSVPVVNDTLYLTVRRLPLADLDWESRGAQITEPNAQWREALIQGILMYAFSKRDTQTFSPQEAAQAEARFLQLVGPPVTAKQWEARRYNANMSMRVRPKSYS